MNKTITGSIPYTLTISDDNDWTIEYESSADNDLASLAIAQRMMEICAVQMRHDRDEAKGRHKKQLAVRLNKIVQSRYGVKLTCDYLQDAYEDYMKAIEQEKVLETLPETENGQPE